MYGSSARDLSRSPPEATVKGGPQGPFSVGTTQRLRPLVPAILREVERDPKI